MKKIYCTVLFLFSFSGCLFAQNEQQLSASEISLAFKKLTTAGSVLYIAAHPDDENTRLLAYLAKERNLRTGYLSLTRGDGGQNLIGKEQGESLGLIRTNELLAARRKDGAEQFFTRANDFGYSKNPEETFAIWNKDSILADVVWTIRQFKPDVVICRFPTTGEGGHGHHTASAILAVEAFEAAADEKKFPEQLKFVKPWKVKRLFWNTFNFGGNNTTAPNQLKIDVGAFNSLLGKGYGEIASESRSMHKSQGFGAAKTRGSSFEYFKILKGDSVKVDLFEGIDLTLGRLTNYKKIIEKFTVCAKGYNYSSPENSLPSLIELFTLVQEIKSTDPEILFWKEIKCKEIVSLIVNCSGLWMEVFSNEFTYVPGIEMKFTTQIINRNKGDVRLNRITFLNNSDTITNLSLKQNELYSFSHKELLSNSLPFSNPFWLNNPHEQGLFNVKEQVLVNRPEQSSATKVIFEVELLNKKFNIERNVVYKYVDPVKGELYRPVELLPPATVNISERFFVFADSTKKRIQFTIKSNKANVKGKLELKLSAGYLIDIPTRNFEIKNKGDEIIMNAFLIPSKIESAGTLQASLIIDSIRYTKSINRIEYDHIPYQFILSEGQAGLVYLNIKRAGLKIAYIPGPGDEIPNCLEQIGYSVVVLTDDLLANENLAQFDAIVTGVRAYNTNTKLPANYKRLMEYINTGGNLIVQYNTNSRVGPMNAEIGPFPFTVSRDRVTDEKSEVRILKPDHPVLNFPNKITKNDFDGWIQERGIYFATGLSDQYETILAMNDPNEKSNEGSLIVARYGKGSFVYTGLSFFRELPIGIPGAYRLFVNLLSIPKGQ